MLDTYKPPLGGSRKKKGRRKPPFFLCWQLLASLTMADGTAAVFIANIRH